MITEETTIECPACNDRIAATKRPRRCPTCGERMPTTGSSEDLAALYGGTTGGATEDSSNRPAAGSRRSATGGSRARGQPGGYTPAGQGLALGLAVATALACAIAWAVIGAVTGFEIAYVAWGIGAAIGAMCVRFGGAGNGAAAACALLTVASIFGGKFMLAQYAIAQAGDQVRETLTRQVYDERAFDATAFAELSDRGDAQMRAFMIDHFFTEATDPAHVPTAEVRNFEANIAPDLLAFASNPPQYQPWQDACVDEILAEVPVMQLVTHELSPMDLLFALLGLTTAFGIVRRVTATA